MINQKKIIKYSFLVALLTSVVGCSSYVVNEGEAYTPNDEISEGPGIFSGNKGAFFLVGNNNTDSKPSKKINSTEETISVINQKIEQLDKDKVELEMLKRRLNNK